MKVLDYEVVKNWPIPEAEQAYSAKDSILYALSVGLGSRPTQPNDLRYLLEDRLAVFPTMSVVLARSGFWLRDPRTGVDWVKLVQVEYDLELLRPLPPAGKVVGRARVAAVVDKGRGRGVLIYITRELRDAASGDVLSVARWASMLRGDGGFSEESGRTDPQPDGVPAMEEGLGEPSFTICETIPESAALLYRMNGDDNPIHADPEVATRAGFERPILHGLCTYAIAARMLVQQVRDGDAAGTRRFGARFSAPVYPGDSIALHCWDRGGGQIRFDASVPARQAMVLKNGIAEFVV